MNRIHRKVWNARRGAYVAVAETAKGRSKTAGCGLVGGLVIGLAALGGAQAQTIAPNTLPTGGQVTAGAVNYGVTGNTLNVNQASQRAAINWNSFSVGSAATVNFNQPNAQAVILNRVVGTERSVIEGALNANGQVWLLNANGLLFGKGAQVNTAGLLASTLNISDADFMAGRSTFESTGGSGRVVNLGTLNAAGGYVALLGQQVVNEGLISARLGTAVLAAGDKVSLNFNGDSLVSATVDRGVLNALVENKQAIIADGGLVMLTAKGLDQVLATVVNNTGEIRAQTVAEKEGRIFLLGDLETDRIAVGGKLDASAPGGGKGGFIETSAAKVSIADDVSVTTRSATGAHGQWLIDPTDFTIAASGGDITGAALGAALAGGNVTIQSVSGATNGNGDIFVSDNIAKASGGDTTLTLQADRSIIIGADTSISSTSGKLNVHLSANNAGGGNATIDLLERSSITTNGGNVIFGGALTSGLPATDNTVDVRLNPNDDADGVTINAGGGDVRFHARDVWLGQYAKVAAANIAANVRSFQTNSVPGIKFVASNNLTIEASDSIQFNGSYSPPAGSASITESSQSILKAGNTMSLSARTISMYGAALKLTGSGSNTLNLTALEDINFNDTSIAFVGAPHLNIALRQGDTQSAVGGINAQYTTLAGYLSGESVSLYDFAIGNGLSINSSHIGIKGASYTLKVYSDTTAQTITPKSLDNGKLAFGYGLSDSVNQLGNLYQPFYYDTDLDRWFKLTFSTYPLDIAIGVGGEASAGWNGNGTLIASNGRNVTDLGGVISNVTFDTSNLANGIGRIVVNYTITAPDSLGTFNLSNTYSLGAGDSFIKTYTEIKNTGTSPLENVRLWLGTRDDYVAISDSNYKTKGNITQNGFTPITTQDEQAKSILISEFDPTQTNAPGSAILFHSTNTDADTVTDSCCRFTNVTNKNPRDSDVVISGDGSYALFMNFSTLAEGGSRGVTWYYGATSLSNINSLVSQVITGGALEPDLPVAPTPIPPPTTNPRLDQAVANVTNAVNPPLPGVPNTNSGAPFGVTGGPSVANVVNVPSGVSLQFAPNESLMIVSSLNGDVPNNPVSLSQARQMMGGGSTGGGGTAGSQGGASGQEGGSSSSSGSAGNSAGGSAGGSTGDTSGSGANGGTGQASQGEQDGSEQSGDDNGRTVAIPASRNSMVQIVNGGVRLPGGVEQQLFVIKK